MSAWSGGSGPILFHIKTIYDIRLAGRLLFVHALLRPIVTSEAGVVYHKRTMWLHGDL